MEKLSSSPIRTKRPENECSKIIRAHQTRGNQRRSNLTPNNKVSIMPLIKNNIKKGSKYNLDMASSKVMERILKTTKPKRIENGSIWQSKTSMKNPQRSETNQQKIEKQTNRRTSLQQIACRRIASN